MNKGFIGLPLLRNLLPIPGFSRNVLLDRSVCTSHCLQGRVKATPEERLCAFNKTQYLHRNDTLKSQRVFYRGNVKYDYTNGRPVKNVKPVYSAQAQEILDKPVDDVYIISHYKSPIYTLEESLSQLKKYAELDFTDDSSVVQLKLSLREPESAGKKKKKKKASNIFKFLSTTELPFPFDETNKVAVFTDQEYLEDLVMKNGAHAAGSLLLIRKVLNDSVDCGAYLCTDGYSRIISDHKELKEKLGSYLPSNTWGVVDEESLLDKLNSLITGVQYDNFAGDGKESIIRVGRVNQPIEELAANIRHVASKVREQIVINKKRIKSDFIAAASVSCCCEDISISIESMP